jgi:carboxylesterase type B
MDEVFKGDSKAIRDFKPNDHAQAPYAADTKFDKKTMADQYIALSNTINDFAFRCGNYFSAVKATSDSRRTADQPVYGYLFDPGPIRYSVMPADNPACAPDNADGFVCHTTELPFVFNTLTSAYAQLIKEPFTRYVPTGAEVALSEKIVAAWAAFAKGDGAARSPATADFDWKPWTAADSVSMFRINPAPSMINAFGNSGCGSLAPDTPLWFPILNSPPGTD